MSNPKSKAHTAIQCVKCGTWHNVKHGCPVCLKVENKQALGYATRLFKSLAPQCEPLEELLGVLTQIDNWSAGIRTENKQLKNKIDILRSVQFSPSGDNHHNAALCPHCGDPVRKLEAENKILKEVIWCLGKINEDELPEVSDEKFDLLFKASKVDIVRIYPRLVLGGLMFWHKKGGKKMSNEIWDYCKNNQKLSNTTEIKRGDSQAACPCQKFAEEALITDTIGHAKCCIGCPGKDFENIKKGGE